MVDLQRTGNFICGSVKLCILSKCVGISALPAGGSLLSAFYEERIEEKAVGDAGNSV